MNEAKPKGRLFERILATLAEREATDRLTKAFGAGTIREIVAQLDENGFGVKTATWTSEGPAKPMAADEMAAGLGSTMLFGLTSRFGISPEELTQLLARHLPHAVRRLSR